MRIKKLIMLVVLSLAIMLLAQVAYGGESESLFLLELRSDATVPGPDATLEQVCRWPTEQNHDMEPFAHAIVARAYRSGQFVPLDLPHLKTMLADAGMNLAIVRFSGATRCEIHIERAATQPTTAPATAIVSETATSSRTLRALLLDETAARCGVPQDKLQVDFAPAASPYLDLQEAECTFGIESHRRGLGQQVWEVQVDRGGKSERVMIMASARAWETRLVATMPIRSRQVIRDTDVEERRMLTEQTTRDLLSNRVQVVGQLAAREIRPGTVFTSYLVSAMPLVTTGQIVNLATRAGAIQIVTVAKAMETGTFGQVIKVRDEATQTVLQARITGPQEAELN